ncbi:TPA: hypothetical protein ACWMA4_006462, partial [Pseudomonas aeruginosa]
MLVSSGRADFFTRHLARSDIKVSFWSEAEAAIDQPRARSERSVERKSENASLVPILFGMECSGQPIPDSGLSFSSATA